MKTFALELMAASPLSIRSDHSPTGTETAKYIAGSTLVGALAATHRLLRQGKSDEFETLFLRDEVSYPHLYPASFKAAEFQSMDVSVYPLPQTAQSCKRFPGFPGFFKERGDEERHGVRDSLLDWAVFRLGEQAGYSGERLLAPLELYEHKYCSHRLRNAQGQQQSCDAPLDHLEGYYRRAPEEGKGQPGKRGLASLDTRLQMHTGINRERGIVEESVLYSREVIEEGTHFWGMVKVPDALAPTFQEFIRQVRTEDVIREETRQTRGLVRVGTGRTRGMGKVYLNVKPMEEEQDEESRYRSFKQRLEAFHAALCTRAKEAGLSTLEPFYFALTLHSPVILCDKALRYRSTIDAETLAHLASLSPSPFRLLYQNVGVRRVTGWQELWGTPKMSEYAMHIGSVFLFSCALTPNDSWLRSLFQLEEQGLGKRRAEGFGRIYLSDPFHLEETLQ